MFAIVLGVSDARLKINEKWRDNILGITKLEQEYDVIAIVGAAHLGSVNLDKPYAGLIKAFKEKPGNFNQIIWGWAGKPKMDTYQFSDEKELNINLESISIYDVESQKTTTVPKSNFVEKKDKKQKITLLEKFIEEKDKQQEQNQKKEEKTTTTCKNM